MVYFISLVNKTAITKNGGLEMTLLVLVSISKRGLVEESGISNGQSEYHQLLRTMGILGKVAKKKAQYDCAF
ncbi:hypothetical protein ACFFUP_16185 [Vibrio ostreicida]|uniref:Uncharacterized protein n=2 Tax=Vibrio ostreicida TaxID=526588 RepID=A0ABT8BN71_9VIBR|nr:hypothetical protein [Vibrio ostreicida]MDN3608597.1 hypothetical protein [Vibrio ostreicida]NPD10992.1 hypothetical protein [Vibrio ostreicida]